MNASSKLPALTIKEWLRTATHQLDSSPTARLDSELLLAYCLGVDRTYLITHDDKTLCDTTVVQAEELLAQRKAHIPIAYLTGYKEFYGRKFNVSSDVLIPRPESETIIELAKKYGVSGDVLDVGCGSGALGITLALELPTQLTLCDISEPALMVARTNARQLGAPSIRFVISDLLCHWLTREPQSQFDTIVANLPYVDRSWERSPETNYEPAMALFANDEGLALIKQLLTQTPHLLRHDGLLFLEADPEQHEKIIAFAQKSDLHLEVAHDYCVVLRQS